MSSILFSVSHAQYLKLKNVMFLEGILFPPGHLMFLFKIQNPSPPQTPSEPLGKGLLSHFTYLQVNCVHLKLGDTAIIVDVGHDRWPLLADSFLAHPDTTGKKSCWLYPEAAILGSRAPLHDSQLPTKGPGS